MREISVCGRQGGGENPTGSWVLEASIAGGEDGQWAEVGRYISVEWGVGMCYPFRLKQIVVATRPYRFYRIRVIDGCEGGHIRIMNLGLWGCRGKCTVESHTAGTEAQLITKESRDVFSYLANSKGSTLQADRIADETGSQIGVSSMPYAYVGVDMKKPHVISKLAICGCTYLARMRRYDAAAVLQDHCGISLC